MLTHPASRTGVDLDRLAAACADLDPHDGPEALIACLQASLPGLTFRLALTDPDWYRLGGLLDAEGRRLARSLEDWVEAESGGDVMTLLARHGGSGLLATSLTGKTRFLIADTGEGSLDFAQVEVEEVQEKVDRELLPAGWMPETIEDVLDPMSYTPLADNPLADNPLGPPHYIFKDLTFFSEVGGELISDYTGDQRFRRFLEEWEGSSAGRTIPLRERWVITRAPALDCQGTHHREVRPLSTRPELARRMTELARTAQAEGTGIALPTSLANQLQAIDRDAGHHLAWYFLAVATGQVPDPLMEALCRAHVAASRDGAPGFLAETDRAVLERWIEEPYHF
ncbi:hypothetical protein [Roseospirillum parvum]|uniref:Uncharacterized protein n=1 Tax=Roseospirillum parvum TaxID=83401 RepID=A0A1G7WN05_9PROT|nr:hypothetical protein [Roseospirillum parvum]SDG73269.1 hypothetical protein SAMN05421742_102260 [Roseospirillum parvum]